MSKAKEASKKETKMSEVSEEEIISDTNRRTQDFLNDLNGLIKKHLISVYAANVLNDLGEVEP
jgi:hypothetical protein